MNRWWLQQKQKLWWKEVRETWLYIFLAFLFMFVHLMLITPQATGYNSSEFSAYLWGLGFHTSVTTVLLFISICLGVTAYAVEQEQETLIPLLSKPIHENDIFATKLGVRLGEILLFIVILGIIEIWTGAWPIEWDIPAPWAFVRWLGGFMLASSGLCVGLYFGKLYKKQTQALLLTALVIIAGYVLFTVSPLKLLFLSEAEPGLRWIVDILIPFITAVIAVMAVILTREEEKSLLVRRPVFAGSLAIFIYAVVFWTVTFIPPGVAWQQPHRYLNHLTIRLGSPEAGLQVLVDRFIEARASHYEGDSNLIEREFIWRTNIRRPGYGPYYDYSTRMACNLMGIEYQPGSSTSQPESPVGEITGLEGIAAKYRRARWIEHCLDMAAQQESSDLYRLTALHLAGVANHAEHTELIAAFLDSPTLKVRLMAAMMLIARDDPRGTRILTRDLLSYKDISVIYRYSNHYLGLGIDFGPELRPLMEEWLIVESNNREAAHKRNIAQFWFREHGSSADIDLVRRSLWLGQHPQAKARSSPADMDILRYLLAWNAPETPDAFWQEARTELVTMQEYYDELKELPRGARRGSWSNLAGRTREHLRKYKLAQESFSGYLTQLAQLNQTDVVDFWVETRPYMRLRVGRYTSMGEIGEVVLSYLPQLGEAGIELLKEVAGNLTEEPTARFRAAMVLASRGYAEFDSTVLQLFEQYRDHYNLMRSKYVLQAFRILVDRDNPTYIGPLIEQAWEDFSSYTDSSRSQRRRRYSMTIWDKKTVDTLEEATGQTFGWDIKAWKRWWDREGSAMAAEQLASYSAGNN